MIPHYPLHAPDAVGGEDANEGQTPNRGGGFLNLTARGTKVGGSPSDDHQGAFLEADHEVRLTKAHDSVDF